MQIIKDKKSRSLAKTLSWRMLACTNGVVVTAIVLGDWQAGLKAGVLANLTAIAIYYFHERIWNSVKWGRDGRCESK